MAINQYIKYFFYSIFFLTLCLAAIFTVYKTLTGDNDKIGLYEAIIGGTIAGFFTVFGVMLTLIHQEFRQKSEAESHKNMLLTQLKFTHDFISNLSSKGPISLYVGLLIYDPDWHKHLQYISLDKNDFRVIVDWFHVMNRVEKTANINLNGSIAADYVLKAFVSNKNISDIEDIINKISKSK